MAVDYGAFVEDLNSRAVLLSDVINIDIGKWLCWCVFVL
jgi:hypothetical protein